MAEEKQLPDLVITDDMAPVIYVPGGLDQFLNQIREAVNEVPDLSTKKGRDRIASLARAVSSSKTAVEKPGRDYLRRLKEAVKPAEAELKRFVDTCDKLRDEVRLPLTEYEDAEKAREAALFCRLDALRVLAEVLDEFGKLAPTELIIQRLAEAKETAIDESWQEVTAEAGVAKDAVIVKLEAALVEAQKRDAEAAELERLRKEQAEAEQRQREEQIRRDAEALAKRQAEAEAQAKIDEANRKANEAQQAAAKAEQDRAEAELRAERERQAERLRQQQAEQARLAEVKRVADEEAARAADVEHQRGVNRQVMSDLVEHAHLTEEQAKAVLTAIVRGKVAPTYLFLRY